jgi:hypothetical protein
MGMSIFYFKSKTHIIIEKIVCLDKLKVMFGSYDGEQHDPQVHQTVSSEHFPVVPDLRRLLRRAA